MRPVCFRCQSCARWSVLLTLACVIGCAGPLAIDRTAPEPAQAATSPAAEARYPEPSVDQFPAGPLESVAMASDRSDAGTPPATAAPPVAVSTEPVSSQPANPAPTVEQTKALTAAIAELQASGAIDSTMQAQLLDGLGSTDPALWPQLLAYFRAAAAKQEVAKSPPAAEPVKLVAASESVRERPEESPTEDAKPIVESPAPDVAKSAEPSNKKPARTRKRTSPKKKDSSKSKAARDAEQHEKTASEKPAAEPSSDAWKEQLNHSIAKLEQVTQQSPGDQTEIGQHVALRMLYLAAGRKEDALKPIAGIPPAQQDFWSKELFGLAAYLDPARNPDNSRRAAEANNHLREAAARLGELATLQVRNLTFCSEVSSYGVYKPFAATEFQAGQELLLYAEIENFKSEQTDRGYHTALKASYQILDERGARVEEKEFALTEEYCQNPRRDFFLRYFIWLPQKIYGGRYTLQFTIEDTLSQKIGQASQEFTIKSK